MDWLVVTQDDVAAINAVLPGCIRVAAVEVDGQLVLGADLLADCEQGGTYEAARELLVGLSIVESP